MIEKKQFEIFPKNMGFFPYVWLVYLAFPIYSLSQQTGWKLVIGSGMLVVFVLAYRQLYFVKRTFIVWACFQMFIAFYLGIFYSPYLIFLCFFYSKCNRICTNKKILSRIVFFISVNCCCFYINV